MIDIHCHILPGLDDGPRDMDESKMMLEAMYNDGTRGVIATSHYNHTIDFHSSLSYGESFSMVESFLSENYPDFKLYRGAEFRIRPNYLDIFEGKKDEILLNGKNYVLIEYMDQIDYKYASEVVYEFKIRGYEPIIAHIERYPVLYDDKRKIELLRENGAYIQISAKALAKGNPLYRKMKKLLKNEYIDFVGSDGHSMKSRSPLLGGAYSEVSRILSREDADRIFIENPLKIIGGEDL